MTTAHKITLAGAIVALVLGGIFLRGWILEREDGIRAAATAQADEKIIAAKTQDIATRDAANASKDATIAQQSAALKTPQQAAQIIFRDMPAPAAGAPAQTAPVVIDRTELSAAAQKELPDTPGPVVVLTADQAKDVAANQLTCKITTNDLSTCKADLADRTAQLAASQAETAAWKTAAKGGTKWQRFGRVMKSVACAGAGSAAGSLAYKQDPTLGGAIGSAGAVAACSIF